MDAICPSCGKVMNEGLITLFDGDLAASVQWHPGFKGLLRDHKVERLVLKGKILARRPPHRTAWRCASCETVVIPGDQTPSA